MEGLFVLPIMAVVATLAVFGLRVERQRREKCYRGAAERLGVTWIPAGKTLFGSGPGLSGTLEGFRLRAEDYSRDKQQGVRLTLDSVGHPRGGIPAGFGLEKEHLSLSLLHSEDLVVGDPTFDESARVRGEARLALAILGRKARREFLAAVRAGDEISVANGAVVSQIFPSPEAEELAAAVRRGLRLATALLLPAGGEIEALANCASEDPAPGVRLRAFETLAALSDGKGQCRATARRLLADQHPEVRLRAATTLGEEGFETLAEIVRSAPRRQADQGDKALWWEFDLDTGRPYELAEALDRTLLGQGRRQARALSYLVAGFPAEKVIPLIREALRGSEPLKVAALAAVARIEDSAFEEAAAEALADPSAAVCAAAVGALRVIGTAASVPRLHALAARSGAFDFALRHAVEAAIAAVQARLTGAAAGQISLAGNAAAGRVSLAGGTTSPEGRLSLAKSPSPGV